MTNKDQGKFLIAIKLMGEQKEFANVPFHEEINPFNLLSTDTILDNLRDSYNFAFIQCCEKFNVKGIDNIYDDLQILWQMSYEIKKESEHGVGGFFLKLGTCALGQNLNVRWLHYKDFTREYAAGLAEGKTLQEMMDEGD